ncbi:MAG: phospho-sugar mutase [Bacteriovoracaceae bacterium]|nr:phospho-sugar mutase [Bacteriovoracaceae bacterium]
MNNSAVERAKAWCQHPAIDLKDRQEIQNLIDKKNDLEIQDRFYRGLEFGTGGMRGVLGMGENRINKYTVRRAAQAVALTLKKHFPQGSSIVVSYDSRNGSREFAEETLCVMAAHGIKGRIFRALTPTPMLSYAIRYYKAQGGAMVTASHNPPKYNGYKVFWNDGAQVVTPVDKEIVETYNSLTDWSELKSMSFQDAISKGFAQDCDSEVDESFFRIIEEKVILNRELCKTKGSELKIIYTPLHGTGLVPCETIQRRLGFSEFHTVKAQALPDGNFSTVKYPNPEDPEALKMAVDEMISKNADIVFGTDPDCDRLGVVVNQKGKPFYVNGNQLGALFLHYIFTTKKARGAIPTNAYVVKSIVTSPVQDAIVKSFGAEIMATLTGFKWMADLIRKLEEQKTGKNFVFASEESFGYMPHHECRDKDGVSSVALMSEIALFYKLKGMTLVDALDEIAEKYGFFQEHLVSLDYEGIEGGQKIQRIMNHFRSTSPKDIVGNSVEKMTDYLSKDSGLPSSNVLGFQFKNGDQLFLRPSGTEPKIKFYIMVCEKEGELNQKKGKAQNKIEAIEKFIRLTCETL